MTAPALAKANCFSQNCNVFVQISIDQKVLEVYENGHMVVQAAVKEPAKAYHRSLEKPDDKAIQIERHFTGRLGSKNFVIDSSKYPPSVPRPYASFINHEFYIFGSAPPIMRGRESHFGFRTTMPAAETINRLVRQYGARNSWISVSN